MLNVGVVHTASVLRLLHDVGDDRRLQQVVKKKHGVSAASWQAAVDHVRAQVLQRAPELFEASLDWEDFVQGCRSSDTTPLTAR